MCGSVGKIKTLRPPACLPSRLAWTVQLQLCTSTAQREPSAAPSRGCYCNSPPPVLLCCPIALLVAVCRGISAALVQAPLSRFGDTAANAFALSLLEQVQLPVAIKTIAASLLAGSFRIALVPIDTVKTMMQVEGKGGMAALRAKVKANGPSAMFHGALASAAATFAGHYPWFAMFNTLQEVVPKPRDDELLAKLSRNAAIGFASSVTSDTISNSLRVIKTYRQTAKETVSYAQAVRNVVASDGLSGLFFRGLSTRVLANGLQGLLFSVVWRALEDKFNKTSKPTAAAAADK